MQSLWRAVIFPLDKLLWHSRGFWAGPLLRSGELWCTTFAASGRQRRKGVRHRKDSSFTNCFSQTQSLVRLLWVENRGF